ncbi:unnamed protein product [Adineta steineri]|uniref:Flavoprotein domain-containing protein n=1 Tax=Adineta steineri TaxID=433720 RepID=A0A814ZQF7_9BILA|nr:unnamed protein product [Adineta steineri]CAF1265842.1 unnamed protein product [Adineta steineri]
MSTPTVFIFVTGSGRAKDVPELVRETVAAGWDTYTILTSNVSSVLSPDEIYNVPGSHAIRSYKDPPLNRFPFGTMLVAPCTFNTFNKLALGLGDNLVTSMIADALGAKCPIFIAPAMNYSLWNHPQTRISEAKLKEWGCTIIPPYIDEKIVTMSSMIQSNLNKINPLDFSSNILIKAYKDKKQNDCDRRRICLWFKLYCCYIICALLLLIGLIVGIVVPLTLHNTIISQSNWLINGDAETGTCESSNGVTHPTGWMYNGTITQVYYNNTAADLLSTDPGPSDRGNCYFYGQISAITSMWQYINMTNSINSILIDNQTVYYNFSAWIGGYSNQRDNAQVSLTFIDQANQKINNTITLGPVSVVDRGSITSLLFRQANGLVPIGARSCIVMATITRGAGTYNDGDIDNIALYFYQ